ncbi:MAG: hypothetical protein PHC88_08405 [Terrimicrobiaceae bacterium]|nr:hypothetical protein [Terrimicrobiaceae bacterium]
MKLFGFTVATLSIAGSLAAGEPPVTLLMPDGAVVECTEVKRLLPAAVQFADAAGNIHIALRKDIPAEILPRLLAMAPVNHAPTPAPASTPAGAGPVLYVEVVAVASKSSTTYQYYDWDGVSRTTKSGSTYEVRLNLRRPKQLTVQILTLVGTGFSTRSLTVDQSRETTFRFETTGSRTITNMWWMTHYRMEGRPRDAWFLQVVGDGKVLAEKGSRPPGLETGAVLEGPPHG